MSPRWGFKAWLAATALLLAFFAFRVAPNLKVDGDLLALLPASGLDADAERAHRQIGDAFARRLLLLVGGETFAVAHAGAQALSERLRASPAFVDVRLEIEASKPAAVESRARFGLLTPADRTRLLAGGGDALSLQARRALYSPAGFAGLTSVREDPLGLFERYLNDAPLLRDAAIEGGVLVLRRDQHVWVVVLTEIRGNPFDQAVQPELALALDEARAAAALRGARVISSGVAPHAVAASKRARAETVWLGGGDLLACALLLLLVFRSLRPMALGLLSVGLGIVAALCCVHALFGPVHFLTLVFGTSLIGVAMDYALHFLCDQFRDPQHWRPIDAPAHIRSSLLLGLGTAVLGYATFATTSLPVLRQIAVFAACGLIVAAATVWLAFPSLSRPATLHGVARWNALATLLRPRSARAWIWLMLAAFAGGGLMQLQTADDIRLLQSSPPQLLAEEQQVRSLLGTAVDSRYFLLEGDSAQQLLEREEALTARIEALQAARYTAFSQAVPSLKRQAANRQLTAALYQPGGVIARHFSVLGFGPETATRLREDFASAPWLLPEDVRANPRLQHQAAQWLGESNGRWRSTVTLADVQDAEALARAADGLPGVRWRDPVSESSAALASQRREALRLLVVVYGLIAGVLIARYGFSEGLRALAAPLGASLLTLAVLGWSGQTLNLFTVLALLLVLGIGNDYVIFLREGQRESRSSGAPPISSRLAVGLAAMTALLAFGGLAFSATPFLRSLGLTLVLGIALTLTLAVFTAPKDAGPALP
ncbi:MAG: MMPL family transporter [Pseudomonadota bacterium]